MVIENIKLRAIADLSIDKVYCITAQYKLVFYIYERTSKKLYSILTGENIFWESGRSKVYTVIIVVDTSCLG